MSHGIAHYHKTLEKNEFIDIFKSRTIEKYSKYNKYPLSIIQQMILVLNLGFCYNFELFQKDIINIVDDERKTFQNLNPGFKQIWLTVHGVLDRSYEKEQWANYAIQAC